MKKFFLLCFMFMFMFSINVYAEETHAGHTCDDAKAYWNYKSDSDYLKFLVNEDGNKLLTIYCKDKNVYLFCFEENFNHYYYDLPRNNETPLNEILLHKDSVDIPSTNYAGIEFPWYFYAVAYTINMDEFVEHYIVDKEYETEAAMLADMSKYTSFYNYKKGIFKEIGKDDFPIDGKLPMLDFKIKQALTMGEGLTGEASVKYTFSWSVAQHDIYANNPNKYVLQMLATAKYTQKDVSGTSTVVAEEVGYINPECNTYVSKGIPIYKESYSFLERTYREKLCEIAGVDKSASSAPLSYYFLFVRVLEPETGKTSLWKVYRCQGRNISSSGYYYDDEGKQYPGDSDDDTIDDSTDYDSDPSTDDYSDPNSPSYNDGAEMDAEHLLNNLEEIISTLKGIPELFEKVFLWMPDYLIVLIATSIGLILVVGFVKMFLR